VPCGARAKNPIKTLDRGPDLGYCDFIGYYTSSIRVKGKRWKN
jgi:hypothetical protein